MFTLVGAHRLGRLQRWQLIEPEGRRRPRLTVSNEMRKFGCDLLAGVALAAETPTSGSASPSKRS